MIGVSRGRWLIPGAAVLLAALSLALAAVAGPGEKPVEAPREGGVVGTGIVGTITALGSIHVNGVRVVFATDMAVDAMDGSGEPAQSLRPGETVVVEAIRDAGTGDFRASRIARYRPLTGPVTQATGNRWTVLGSEVVATGDTVFPDGRPVLGDWVAVDGIWTRAGVRATVVRRVAADGHAAVTGSLARDDGGWHVAGTRLSGLAPEHAAPGDAVTVLGAPEDGGLRVRQMVQGLYRGPVDRVLVEGILSLPDATGLYTVLGTGAIAYAAQPDMQTDTARGVFCARMDAPGLSRVRDLPDDATARAAALAGRGGDPCEAGE